MNHSGEASRASSIPDKKIEAGRQQHVIVDGKRLITLNLMEICLLLEKVMEQQGDESMITCNNLDWNIMASQLDKDPFELEYFWRVFNPDIHFKPSLGYAVVPIELNLNQETKLLYANTDHRTNTIYNYNLQSSIYSKMDFIRSQTSLKPILDFVKIKTQLLKSAHDRKGSGNVACTPADGAGGK